MLIKLFMLLIWFSLTPFSSSQAQSTTVGGNWGRGNINMPQNEDKIKTHQLKKIKVHKNKVVV